MSTTENIAIDHTCAGCRPVTDVLPVNNVFPPSVSANESTQSY